MLPLAEYYKHTEMRDGHLNKCKVCVRIYTGARSKLPSVREYDRNRPNARERNERHVIRQRLKYGNDPAYRVVKMEKQRESRKDAGKKQYLARGLVNNAIRDGRLVKPISCERCKAGDRLHGHHEDYDKPLDVVWLCTICHGKRHKEIRAAKRNSVVIMTEYEENPFWKVVVGETVKDLLPPLTEEGGDLESGEEASN